MGVFSTRSITITSAVAFVRSSLRPSWDCSAVKMSGAGVTAESEGAGTVSVRERGTVFALWNIAHNVGGGLTGLIAAYSTAWMGWRSAFYVPGVLAILCACYLVT